MISIGAHIHHINVVAPQSSVVPDLEIVQVIMPAVSPVYNNNPGYGLLNIDASTDKVESFKFTFLQLEEFARFGKYTYETYDPSTVGGFDYNDAKSVRAWSESLFYDF